MSSQAETRHCQVVSQLTTSVLKGFGFTLISVYNPVMGEGQEGEGKEGWRNVPQKSVLKSHEHQIFSFLT